MRRLAAVTPLLFLLLGFTWGSSYLAIKIVGADLEPFTLVSLRLAIGVAVLVAALRLRGDSLPPRAVWPHLAVVGLIGMVIPFTLISWGQQGVDAGLASIFNAANPLFTVVLAGLFLADEPFRLGRFAGILIGFAGVIVVVGSGVRGGGDPLSIVALVLAVSSYAATAVWTRRFLAGQRPLSVATGQAIVAALVAPILALLVEGLPERVPHGSTLGAIAWLGVVCSGIGPLVFFSLLSRWGATRTAVVNYLIPIVGVTGGAILFGEQVGPAVLVGALLVLAGVTMANRTWSVRRAPALVLAPARSIVAILRGA